MKNEKQEFIELEIKNNLSITEPLKIDIVDKKQKTQAVVLQNYKESPVYIDKVFSWWFDVGIPIVIGIAIGIGAGAVMWLLEKRFWKKEKKKELLKELEKEYSIAFYNLVSVYNFYMNCKNYEKIIPIIIKDLQDSLKNNNSPQLTELLETEPNFYELKLHSLETLLYVHKVTAKTLKMKNMPIVEGVLPYWIGLQQIEQELKIQKQEIENKNRRNNGYSGSLKNWKLIIEMSKNSFIYCGSILEWISQAIQEINSFGFCGKMLTWISQNILNLEKETNYFKDLEQLDSFKEFKSFYPKWREEFNKKFNKENKKSDAEAN